MSILVRVEPRIEAVRHGFTTRVGGVSTGPLASLNLAMRPGETPENLIENWDRAAAALDPSWRSSNIALVEQVHGGEVIQVDAPSGPLEVLGRADAMVTTRTDIVLAVRTADCVPVVLEAAGCIAAAHAGWRGVAAKVLERTVEAMRELGAFEIHAVVGPHIGVEAYEVGREVVEGICATGVPEPVFVRAGERPHVDVGAAAAYQLQRLGVRVRRDSPCTFSEPRFYSHRRDAGVTGRQAGLIGRLAA